MLLCRVCCRDRWERGKEAAHHSLAPRRRTFEIMPRACKSLLVATAGSGDLQGLQHGLEFEQVGRGQNASKVVLSLPDQRSQETNYPRLLVKSVAPGSAAWKRGFRKGDAPVFWDSYRINPGQPHPNAEMDRSIIPVPYACQGHGLAQQAIFRLSLDENKSREPCQRSVLLHSELPGVARLRQSHD